MSEIQDITNITTVTANKEEHIKIKSSKSC